ncbi:MAG: hypothetical protein M3Q14_04345 [bacterium]|nr:hypothetical protein [bacterium]
MSTDYRHKYGYGGARRAPASYGEEIEKKPAPEPETKIPELKFTPNRIETIARTVPRRNVRAQYPDPIVQPLRPSLPRVQRRVPWRRLRLPVGILVFTLIVAGLFFFTRSRNIDTAPGDMITQVVSELSIQNDNNPAILGVVDESKVNQPFLEEAKNGDKVLLFYKAKLSVLYRPKERRLVKSGKFTPPPAKVFFRNGANDQTRIDAVKAQLKDFKDITFNSQDKSILNNYAGVKIVDVTGRYDETVKAIVEKLDATATALPTGETAPDADILIIVGK